MMPIKGWLIPNSVYLPTVIPTDADDDPADGWLFSTCLSLFSLSENHKVSPNTIFGLWIVGRLLFSAKGLLNKNDPS